MTRLIHSYQDTFNEKYSFPLSQTARDCSLLMDVMVLVKIGIFNEVTLNNLALAANVHPDHIKKIIIQNDKEATEGQAKLDAEKENISKNLETPVFDKNLAKNLTKEEVVEAIETKTERKARKKKELKVIEEAAKKL